MYDAMTSDQGAKANSGVKLIGVLFGERNFDESTDADLL
jgi:hypothetical protein